eukprot:COSAG06_NODE_22436_length_723_cov_1.421474_1_plen_217_part_10
MASDCDHAATLRTKINQLVGDYLYTNYSIGPATSPFNAMISSLTVEANPTAPKSFFSMLAYTNANLVRLRGRADFSPAGSLNTSTLPRGQLRAGLPATCSIYNDVFGGWGSIGNPYDSEAGYLMALGHPVNTATDGTGSTIGVTAAERHTVDAMGAHYPGQRVESKSPDPIHKERRYPDAQLADLDAEQRHDQRDCGVRALVALVIARDCYVECFME